MRLDDKTLVVTGGASGMGKAAVLMAAEAGASVFIGDVDEDRGRQVAEEGKAANLAIEYLKLDLTDGASIDGFAETVLDRTGGRLDGLVNAAGWGKVEFFLDNDPALWERVLAVNLTGGVRLTQKFTARMVEARSGKIVNVSSDAGRVGSSGEVVYAAAKGGMIAFTKSLAREVARYNINVNCICPGPTDTPLFHAQEDNGRKEALVRAIPFRRLGQPEEIASAILFLLSGHSNYITGQVMSVSGGLTMAG